MKRYADEPGADIVRGLSDIVVSSLARAEVPAAILRKQRLGELSPQDAATLLAAFEWDWFGAGGDGLGAFAVVAANAAVLEVAVHALSAHPLRAYDAVQLASALAARSADPDLSAFACYDDSLAAAAHAEGFRSIP